MDKPVKSSFFQRIKNIFFYQPLQSKDEFFNILKEAEENHIIDYNSRLIIDGAIQIENLEVRDAMVPKSKMVMIENNLSVNNLLKIMTNSGHSRFPVLNEQKNKIKGIIFAKDLLSYLAMHDKKKFDYTEYLKNPFLIPESKKLGALLRNFQQRKSHMAIVLDEYSEIAGLVTLEDILEQIVGEIEDEHDLTEDNIINFGKGRYLLKASTTLEEFNEFFNTNIKADNIDTVAGFVIKGFTYLPEQMSEIILQGFNFKVLKTDSRKLHLLEVVKIVPKKSHKT